MSLKLVEETHTERKAIVEVVGVGGGGGDEVTCSKFVKVNST